jgi:hypothetical protein
VWPDPLFQFSRMSLNPAEDGCVVYVNAAILQHELKIAVTDGEHQLPTNRPKDHLSGELPPLSRLSLFRHGTALYLDPLVAKSCNRTGRSPFFKGTSESEREAFRKEKLFQICVKTGTCMTVEDRSLCFRSRWKRSNA